MRRLNTVFIAFALLALAIQPALAQQPPPGGQHGQPGTAPTQAPGAGHGGSGGMMGGGMMGGMRAGRGGEGPLALCPTAAMLAHHEAKAMARSLKLCGDLLKAMGDVLLKHGAELEKAGR